MLLVQTVLTLMTGLSCRPAGMPVTDWIAGAWSSTDPPIVWRTNDQKESRKVIVRLKDGCDDDQARADQKTCRVIVKRLGSDGDQRACCGQGCRPGMTPTGPMGDKHASAEAKCIKIVARVGAGPCNDDPGPATAKHKFCIKLDDKDPAPSCGESTKFFSVFNVADNTAEPDGPWLGVQFGPVSKALASHLGLDKGVGQMVLNVIEDSPADKAGLQQYDVIVSIDKKDAPAKIEDFMNIVKEFEPGQAHTLSLIRGGHPVEAKVMVGTRPEEVGSPKFKFDTELEELTQNNMLQRGGILRQGPDGKWIVEGFGDLKDMPDMGSLDHLFGWAGGLPGSQFDVDIQTDKGAIKIEGHDGKFTVTRTKTDDGDKKVTTTKIYDSDKELKADDPEAYKVLKDRVKAGIGVHRRRANQIFVGPGSEGFKNLPNGAEIEKKLQEAMKGAEAAEKKAAQAVEKANKSVARETEKLREGRGGSPFGAQQARISFYVGSAGKINVTTRKDSEELTQTYDNAEALKKARPDLYEKYQKLNERPGDTAAGD